MALHTDLSFSHSFQLAIEYAPHAAQQLWHNSTGYQGASIATVALHRQRISLGSPDTGVNDPKAALTLVPYSGWLLDTEGFILVRAKKLMAVWEDWYATPLSVSTFDTVLRLIDGARMEKVADELKRIARQ